MVKLKWLKSAKDDLKDIYVYIAVDSKKYAEHQIFEIRKDVSILKTYPSARKIVDELEENQIREIVSGHYRIFYRIVSKDLIHILLVHHGARKFPRRKRK